MIELLQSSEDPQAFAKHLLGLDVRTDMGGIHTTLNRLFADLDLRAALLPHLTFVLEKLGPEHHDAGYKARKMLTSLLESKEQELVAQAALLLASTYPEPFCQAADIVKAVERFAVWSPHANVSLRVALKMCKRAERQC